MFGGSRDDDINGGMKCHNTKKPPQKFKDPKSFIISYNILLIELYMILVLALT